MEGGVSLRQWKENLAVGLLAVAPLAVTLWAVTMKPPGGAGSADQ